MSLKINTSFNLGTKKEIQHGDLKMNEQSKNSCFSTIHLMIIKELRLERGVHQGVLAQAAGKTPNAWTKIENGQSVLTVDALFGACSALNITPVSFMSLVEKLIPEFNRYGYYFHPGTIDQEEDSLLPLMLGYFNSKGFESLKNRPFDRISISSIGYPFLGTAPIVPTAVRYCFDTDFRTWVDNGAGPNYPALSTLF